jgi:hypothetical protein
MVLLLYAGAPCAEPMIPPYFLSVDPLSALIFGAIARALRQTSVALFAILGHEHR